LTQNEANSGEYLPILTAKLACFDQVAAREQAEADRARAEAAVQRAEADTAKMEADKERAEANVAKAVAEKEQAEAEGAAKELKLRNELETLRQASGSDSRELEARLNAANAALKVENEGLSRQLFELKADGADRIESEKALATASLTAQLAKSQQVTIAIQV